MSESDFDHELPAGALDFLKRAPTFLTAQGYRNAPFTQDELEILQAHLDSWRSLLSKHGIIYDGIVLQRGQFRDLLYHVAMAVDTIAYPAALPLVLDALFELAYELSGIDWEIHGVEQIVTRFQPDYQTKSLVAGRRLFTQHFHGTPSAEEDAQFDLT